MAELADALDLGSSGIIPLEVQILSPAPLILKGFLRVSVEITNPLFFVLCANSVRTIIFCIKKYLFKLCCCLFLHIWENMRICV